MCGAQVRLVYRQIGLDQPAGYIFHNNVGIESGACFVSWLLLNDTFITYPSKNKIKKKS